MTLAAHSTIGERPTSGHIAALVDESQAAASSALERQRRSITLALGLVWLLDAALQFQPYMFTRAFPDETIKSVGDGSPSFVSAPTHWAATLMADHIVVWNTLFATVQLLIAVGLLFRRTTKVALLASIGWALSVWWLGEGLGGVLAGAVSPLSGLPGAVVLYALIAVLAWPRQWPDADAPASVAAAGPLRPSGARLLWLLVWASFAFETLRPATRSPSALHGLVVGAEDGEPGWIKAVDRAGAAVLDHRGTEASLVLAVAFVFIAVCVFWTSFVRAGVALAFLTAAIMWTFGQDFGDLATGQATDPNTGPLLMLLAVCYWPLSRLHDTARPESGESRTVYPWVRPRLPRRCDRAMW